MTRADLPGRLLAALSPDQPAGRFLWHVLLLSLAGLLPVLALYVALIPGFAAHLLQGGPAAAQFLRQVVTNGVTTVVVMNAAALIVLHRAATGAGPAGAPWRLILTDILLRLGLFIALHAVVFWGSALMFGAFGGDPLQALRVVAPTLAQAGTFGNLSGVYLYAGLLCALPLQLALLGRQSRGTPTRTALALALLAGQVLLLTGLARLAL
ncbi:hypothetical protein HUK65_15165 [Rhodobacteraceae bacterium 2376]|uniref:Uncharacterized protein n=1 Tax=Rhabdonatronobacter sediminivivens TaxID=2743469 RepID=A0A7Z0I2E0_9RHOB|nr:hypothetical protein [Rhabdonatronobacter sediminivivens]NYS26327.1 hypothetical protein [Rhabdonatronobacter sediminivivens]